jgi:hypothetical protein
MYLIGQLLSGNLLIYWKTVFNIICSYHDKYLQNLTVKHVDPNGRVVLDVVLRPLA